ncbi:MAG: hypothetical protein WAT09_04685 [Paracoccaceae bacterium]
MSNTDSFIDEVSEEVRRDRLFKTFRKYGWIGIVLVLGIVGGTAVNQVMKARAETRAEAFGDALLGAMAIEGSDARRAALTAIAGDAEQDWILALQAASDPSQDPAATLAALDRVIAGAAANPAYHDLAVLKRAILAGVAQPLADRRTALQAIAQAGRPYRALAAEQLAYLLIEEGQTDAAIAALQALAQDQDASASLKGRATQVVIALGGKPAAQDGGTGATSGG